MKVSSSHLHIRKTASLRISSNLVYTSRKLVPIHWLLCIRFETFPQHFYAVQLQCRTIKARKNLPIRNRLFDQLPRDRLMLHKAFQHRFIAHGKMIVKLLSPLYIPGKIHTTVG